jgi:HPt (histidine-containing phosphotransfer) domain-containing protein
MSSPDDPRCPPFALSELLERCMGNPQIACLLLDKFAQQMRGDLEAIERQLAAGDGAQIARTAHALKGAAGAVAAGSLHDTAAALESWARGNELDRIRAGLEALRQDVARCLQGLPAARQSLSAGLPGGTPR